MWTPNASENQNISIYIPSSLKEVKRTKLKRKVVSFQCDLKSSFVKSISCCFKPQTPHRMKQQLSSLYSKAQALGMTFQVLPVQELISRPVVVLVQLCSLHHHPVSRHPAPPAVPGYTWTGFYSTPLSATEPRHLRTYDHRETEQEFDKTILQNCCATALPAKEIRHTDDNFKWATAKSLQHSFRGLLRKH